jgi:hypothetical protein
MEDTDETLPSPVDGGGGGGGGGGITEEYPAPLPQATDITARKSNPMFPRCFIHSYNRSWLQVHGQGRGVCCYATSRRESTIMVLAPTATASPLKRVKKCKQV